ncbi:MAG: DNA recombination/repair protein RecA, partial [Melioribacteraceae bacterium]|nr:DNA recombination/repair protein RecA [Melioribacteraceae bacterium]
GNRTKVKVVKSKVAPPFKEVEFDILYNEGISKSGDLIDIAVNSGIIKKSGAWFSFGEDRFQGREQFRQKLNEDPNMYKTLEEEVKDFLGMNGKEAVSPETKKVDTTTEKSDKKSK